MSPAAYSAAYNGIYIFTEAAITVVIMLLPPVAKALASCKALAVQE